MSLNPSPVSFGQDRRRTNGAPQAAVPVAYPGDPNGSRPSAMSSPFDAQLQLRRQNMGLAPRGPSPNSNLGLHQRAMHDPALASAMAMQAYQRANVAANAPTSSGPYGGGSASATLPGGQTVSRMYAPSPATPPSPEMLANRKSYIENHQLQGDMALSPYGGAFYSQDRAMGDVNVQNSQAMVPFQAPFAQQAVRGATIANDNAAAQGPANVGLTNAQAGAVTAGQGTTPKMISDLQAELRRHQTENASLRSQLEKYQAGEQRQQAAAAKAAQPPKPQAPVRLDESERRAAHDVGYGAVMGMRQGKAPGDPTTQPAAQGAAPQPAATQQSDQVKMYQGYAYQRGADGMYHKIKQPTSQPTQ